MRCTPRRYSPPPGADVDKAVSEGHATLGMTRASDLIGAEGRVRRLPAEDVQRITVYATAVCANAAAPQTGETFIR